MSSFLLIAVCALVLSVMKTSIASTTATTTYTTTTTLPTTTTTLITTTTTPITTTTTPYTTITTTFTTPTTPITTTTTPPTSTTTIITTETTPATSTTSATTTPPLDITTTTPAIRTTLLPIITTGTTIPTTKGTKIPTTTGATIPTTSGTKILTTRGATIPTTRGTTIPTTTSKLPTATTTPLATTTLPPITTNTFGLPVVQDMSPKFGPLAGSTRVVIQGIRLNNTIAEVNFEENGPAVIYNSTYYKVTLLSPPANVTANVSLNFVTAYNQEIVPKLSFEYRPNPSIAGFDPAPHQLTTGGSPLTVIGENLDSVASPQLKVTVVQMAASSRSKRIVKRATPMSTNSYYQDCTFDETTRNMTCLLPDLQLGDNFTRKLQRDQEANVSTSTTQPGSVAKLYGPNDTVAFVYIGFVFDGYTKYDNISDPKSGLNDALYLNFIPPPAINSSTEVVNFDPKTDDVIEIKGKQLQLCCSYGVRCEVFIGRAPCTILSITDNRIRCRPPKEKPQSDPDDAYCTDRHQNSLTIKLVVGFYTNYYRCLEYYYNFDKVPLIVGLTVGLGLSILILLSVTAVCFYRRRKKKLRQNVERRHNQPVREGMELKDTSDLDYLTAVTSGFESDVPTRDFREQYGAAGVQGREFESGEIPGKRFSVEYESRISLSEDELGPTGHGRRTIYPPPPDDLGVAGKDLVPDSNGYSRFLSLGDDGTLGKSPQINGNLNLEKTLEGASPSSSRAAVAGQGYLKNDSRYDNEDNYDRRVSLSEDLESTQNRLSIFPPPPDLDAAGNYHSTTLRVISNRDSVFPP